MDSFKMLKRRATDLLNSVPQSLPSIESLSLGHHGHGHGHKGGAPTMKGTWEKISGLPSLPRSSHSVNIVGGTIYVFGGDPADNDMHAITLPFSGAPADYYTIKAKTSASNKPIPTIEVTDKPIPPPAAATEKPIPTPAKPESTSDDDEDDDDDDDDDDDNDEEDSDEDSEEDDSDEEEAGPATTTLPTNTAKPPTLTPTPTITTVPSPRIGHTTATIGHRIFLFGGRRTSDPSSALDEAGRVWVFDTRSHTWSHLDPVSATTTPPTVPSPRSDHTAVATDKPNEFNQAPTHPKPLTRTATWKDWALGTDDVAEMGTPQRPIVGNVAERAVDPDQSGFGTLIIHGGLSATGAPTSETWSFDVHSRTWQRLPDAPGTPRAAAALALSHSRLYRFGGVDANGSPLGGQLDFLDLGVDRFDDGHSAGEVVVTARGGTWQSLLANSEDVGYKEPDPTAAPVLAAEPWPGKRAAARMEAVTVGGGREYLVLMLGKGERSGFWDDVWTFLVPGHGGLADSFMEAVGRGRVGGWTRVEAGPEDDEDDESAEGPGGRGGMGSVPMGDLEESGIVIWGGEGAGGKRLGDGWIFRLR